MGSPGSKTLAVHRLESAHDPGFQALVAIYRAALPGSERKPDAQLAEMIARPEYLFSWLLLTALSQDFRSLCI